MHELSARLPAMLAPINTLLVPLIKAGFGAPFFTLFGLVVLEVSGRRSGRVFAVPLLAWTALDLVLVSTVREESAWVKNLDAAGECAVWLRGMRCNATLEQSIVTPITGIRIAVLRVV